MIRRSSLAALGLGSGTLFSPPAFAEPAGSERKSWQPDGRGYRARIGLLTPNDDAVTNLGLPDKHQSREERLR